MLGILSVSILLGAVLSVTGTESNALLNLFIGLSNASVTISHLIAWWVGTAAIHRLFQAPFSSYRFSLRGCETLGTRQSRGHWNALTYMTLRQVIYSP